MLSHYLGFGLGLRSAHYAHVLENKPKVDWFEIISENFFTPGGVALQSLDLIRTSYPIVMHGVSLSIGSVDPLDKGYLTQLKTLIDRLQPPTVSDHLCWTGVNKMNSHDLLPLPYTEESLQHVIDRIKQVQDFLGRQILLENPSTYLAFKHSTIAEDEFLARMADEADCYLLLDINNVYVNSVNHQFDAITYINRLPKNRIRQYHLAGHLNKGTYIIDTHDAPIVDEVWRLYEYCVGRFGPVSTMIERDENIPEFSVLYDELMYAKKIFHRIHSRESELPETSL